MTGRLSGKIAVVTAAAQGIGRATALRFAAEGARVIATDIAVDGLDGLADAGVAETGRLDVRDTAAVDALAARLAGIDILFNCAGFVHHGSVLECSDADWDASFDLNVKSMHRTIRAFLPGMLARGGASIVNMSSAASSLKGTPKRHVYGASKAAVIGLTKAVAADFIAEGIRCNAICPGTVRTPSWEARVAALAPELGGHDKAHDWFMARQPMGRIAEAEEIAALAAYLAGDDSAFMTGAALPIDGGWTL